MNRSYSMAFVMALVAAALLPLGAYANEKPACCAEKAAAAPAEQAAETPAQMSCCAEGQCHEAGAQASAVLDAPGHAHGAVQTAGRGGGHGQAGGAQVVMQGAHALINSHTKIERKVEEVPGGIKSTTTTSDPELLAVLQKHPREMYEHLENGGRVRQGDPLFRELAQVQDKIDVVIRDIENGIEVTSTSKDENVTKLIRLHAAKVSDFVARGHAAMREHTPLPADYVRSTGEAASSEAECCAKGEGEHGSH